VSARAALPLDGAAWLAVVLPVLRASASHREAARSLTAAGHAVASATVQRWHAWLVARAHELPTRTAGPPRTSSSDTARRSREYRARRRAKTPAQKAQREKA
jgi:NADH:ubiquinone oxidoreductase subunit